MRINPDAGKAKFRVGGGRPARQRLSELLRLAMMGASAILLFLWAVWENEEQAAKENQPPAEVRAQLPAMALPDFTQALPLPDAAAISAASSAIDFLATDSEQRGSVMMPDAAGYGWGLQQLAADMDHPPIPRGVGPTHLLNGEVSAGSAVFATGVVEMLESATPCR